MFEDLRLHADVLVLHFGTFVSNGGGDADRFCVLARYAGADEWGFYESRDDFLRQFPKPEQFLDSLHGTVSIEFPDWRCFYDPETGCLSGIQVEAWPWE